MYSASGLGSRGYHSMGDLDRYAGDLDTSPTLEAALHFIPEEPDEGVHGKNPRFPLFNMMY